jgi:hypothetical protein
MSFGVSFVSRLCGGDERSYRTLPLHRLQLNATLLEREQLCVKDILVSFAKKHGIPAASVPLLQLAARGVEGEARQLFTHSSTLPSDFDDDLVVYGERAGAARARVCRGPRTRREKR